MKTGLKPVLNLFKPVLCHFHSQSNQFKERKLIKILLETGLEQVEVSKTLVKNEFVMF